MTGSWGSYSWPLHPDPGTQTYGRSKFNIHGGTSWGSAGCIDLKGNDSALAGFLTEVLTENCCCCYIPVKVAYAKRYVTKTERWSMQANLILAGASAAGALGPQ